MDFPSFVFRRKEKNNKNLRSCASTFGRCSTQSGSRRLWLGGGGQCKSQSMNFGHINVDSTISCPTFIFLGQSFSAVKSCHPSCSKGLFWIIKCNPFDWCFYWPLAYQRALLPDRPLSFGLNSTVSEPDIAG